ncbi:MAG: 23S rRNA (pseudouridine(1915)-N(3))-methyltransferase RlmH [Eubacteriales bacterium]
MKITIICVGKVKESFYRESIEEFIKRLSRYCNLSIIEVSDEHTPDGLSQVEEELLLKKEGERIQKHCKEEAYKMVLTIDGQQCDSVGFATHLKQLGTYGTSHIQFIIGGSLGLWKEIIEQADEQLSFSKMTFPHQLMRVILLEQIYRGFRIMKNEPYHK